MTLTDDTQLTPWVKAGLLRSLERRIDVAGDRDMVPVIAPSTELQIGSTPQAVADDVLVAVDTSRKAQSGWGTLTAKTRGRISV